MPQTLGLAWLMCVVLALGLSVGWLFARRFQYRINTRLEVLAEVAASVADTALRRAADDLDALARLTDADLTPERRQWLTEAVSHNPLFHDAGIVDADGNVVHWFGSPFAGPLLSEAVVLADPNRRCVQVAGRLRSPATNRYSIVVALPLMDGAQLTLLMDPRVLTLPFNGVDIGPSGHLDFLAVDGSLLASTRPMAAAAIAGSAGGSPSRMRVAMPAADNQIMVVLEADPTEIDAGGAGLAPARRGPRYRPLLADSDLVRDLRRAIARGELTMEYQPIVELHAGVCVAAEALIRWEHPVRGHLSPAAFVPLAMEAGLMEGLTAAVMERVCRDAAYLSGAVDGGLRISVNCPTMLFEGFILDRLVRTWDPTLLGDGRLILEVTEESFCGDRAEVIAETMARLRAVGVGFALDDFGTGYSGLAALKDLRFDYLKIDRSFVQAADAGAPGAALLDTLVDLALRLGAEPVAEGVETALQRERLCSGQVRLAQGWLFARSLTPAAFVDYARGVAPAAA